MAGIHVTGLADGLKIQGNAIGTDPTGTLGRGNGDSNGAQRGGVFLDRVTVSAGMAAVEVGSIAGGGNLISGNIGPGVTVLGGAAHQILGNRIGTNEGGTVGLANRQAGVKLMDAEGVLVGGITAVIGTGAGNLISGNAGAGVEILGTSTGVRVRGNAIGTDAGGRTAISNRVGVSVQEGTGNFVGDGIAGAGNLISGNSDIGVELRDGAVGNFVQGNRIGIRLDESGTLSNKVGILIDEAASNQIGGTSPLARNWIAGNAEEGVMIRGADSTLNQVLGNWIGLLSSDNATLGNRVGVVVTGARENTIGGVIPGSGNVIAGQFGAGIRIENVDARGNANRILGNRIGTNSSGMVALGNQGNGVELANASGNVIGGREAGAGNWISASTGAGIEVRKNGTNTLAADANVIQGNQVGIGMVGQGSEFGNLRGGVVLIGARGSEVGGSLMGEGNRISGNASHGIEIQNGSGNVARGNQIGGESGSPGLLGNAGHGIFLNGTSGNRIGPDPLSVFQTHAGAATSLAANTILGNRLNGVLIAGEGSGNVVSGNEIGANQVDGVGISGAATSGNRVIGNTIGGFGGGTPGLGNSGQGVNVDGSPGNWVDSNRIVGNQGSGIRLSAGANGTMIRGNAIGLSEDGSPLGNTGSGIQIELATGNRIGGPNVGEGNVITANRAHGISIARSAIDADQWNNWIEANQIGSVAGSAGTDLGNLGNGVDIFESNRNVLVENRVERNAGSGVEIRGLGGTSTGAAGNVVMGGTLSANELHGALLNNAKDTWILGPTAMGNRLDGILMTGEGATNNFVVGSLVSQNTGAGVEISGQASRNYVRDSRISGNQGPGVMLVGQSRRSAIWGNVIDQNQGGGLWATTPENLLGGGGSKKNHVFANANFGMLLEGETARENVISNNRIGFEELAGGAFRVPADSRQDIGLLLRDAPGNFVLSGNVITGNRERGVQVEGASFSTQILGNTIGLDPAGNPLPVSQIGGFNTYQRIGIVIDNAAGTVLGYNQISGNDDMGVLVFGPARQGRLCRATGLA